MQLWDEAEEDTVTPYINFWDLTSSFQRIFIYSLSQQSAHHTDISRRDQQVLYNTKLTMIS